MSNILPIKSSKQAAQEALKEIDEGRTGDQLGLITRFSSLDQALGKWRFNNQIVLAGMSGGGKSWMLNMLRKDFANKELNGNFKKKFRQIHFAFEMSASDEIIRSASSDSKTSYQDIISLHRTLPDDKYEEIVRTLKLYEELDIEYVEVTGSVQQISDTIDYYQSMYPDCHLVISLDHTLLTDYLHERDEISLVTNLSGMMLQKRKKINSLNILIAQLNDKIEEDARILNPDLHFPNKKDVHGAKSVFRDADIFMIIHAPEKLGITAYGKERFRTGGIVFNHLLKNRKLGVVGVKAMKQDYANGNLIEIEKNTLK